MNVEEDRVGGEEENIGIARLTAGEEGGGRVEGGADGDDGGRGRRVGRFEGGGGVVEQAVLGEEKDQ